MISKFCFIFYDFGQMITHNQVYVLLCSQHSLEIIVNFVHQVTEKMEVIELFDV